MIDSPQNRGPAACLITVNGESLAELNAYVREVTVRLKRGVSATATILLDAFRDERGQWSVQDSGRFSPWDDIVISALFGRSIEEEVMRGVVRELRMDYPEDMSGAHVAVEVQDDLIKLDREQRHGVLSSEGEEKSDGQLARELAEDVGLRDVTVEDGLTAGALQIDSTPIKMLQDRAEANGFELYTRQGALYFGPPKLSASPQKSILVYAGPETNCTQFAIQHDGHKPDQVRMTREPEKQDDKALPALVVEPDQKILGSQALTSEGRNLRPFVWSLDRPTGASESEAESRAQAKANESQFKITAKGLLDGTIYGHVLWPYSPVDVDGVGETYGGVYYVDEVTHRFSANSYEQNFTVIRNATN